MWVLPVCVCVCVCVHTCVCGQVDLTEPQTSKTKGEAGLQGLSLGRFNHTKPQTTVMKGGSFE